MLGFERRWAHAVLEGFAPPGQVGLAPRAGEIDYVGCFRRVLRSSTPRAAFGTRLALWIAALAPLWLWGKLRSAARVDVQSRSVLLRQLLSHRSFLVRELVTLLKLTASFALLGQPRMREKSNYDRGVTPPWGEWPVQAGITRSGTRRRLDVVQPSDVSEGA